MLSSPATGGMVRPIDYTRYGCNSGFTLIELCVCLLLLSFMVSFSVQAFQSDTEGACRTRTDQQLQQIRQHLANFVARTGRYPLPAGRSIGIGNAAYGSEVATPTDTRIHRIVATQPVLVGALPHASIGLPMEMGSDCWGTKFTYAVTESHTTTVGYAAAAQEGGITVRNGRPSQYQIVTTKASYVVVSHGADALGGSAMNYQGSLKTCNSEAGDGSIQRVDKENCDTLDTVFYSTPRNSGDTASRFFDDHLIMAERPNVPEASCAAQTVTWGSGCSAPALLTLGGLSVNVTNIAAGYTGVALSTCTNGVRSTLGVCLPIGFCTTTNPRTGNPMTLLTGVGMNFGPGICKRYACCSGVVSITPLAICPIIDLPGLAISCP